MELLVHISAPSSRRDDDRYTLQARNYLAYIAGLRQGNDDAASETVDTVTTADTDADRAGRNDDSITETQFQSFDNRSHDDNINHSDTGSRDEDSTGHLALLQARAPSFPFPSSAESNLAASAKNNNSYSFTSVSSVFTSPSSVLRLQTQSRKRSFSEFVSSASFESAAISPQRRRLSHHSSLAPKTPLNLTQDDYMNGDTTDIALAIAEAEEQKAIEQADSAGKHELIKEDGKECGKAQDLQRTSQRTESLLDSSPCDGRETDCETIRSEMNSVKKEILLVTPNLPRYLPAPIAVDMSTSRNSIPSGIGPAKRKSPASVERFFSASSTISCSPAVAYKSPKVSQKINGSSPTKSGSRRQSLPSSHNLVLQGPLSTLPLMHTPARPSKASLISDSSIQQESYVTSALEYLISIPLLLKNYNCSMITPSPSSRRKKSKISGTTTKHQSRPLRPSERGYWSLDPSPWPPALQSEFWTYLGRIVRLGRAGWGVWCVRAGKFDDDHDDHCYHESYSSNFTSTTVISPSTKVATTTDADADKPTPPSNHPLSSSLGPIKIFCWGEIVPHIYLLLFVASRRALRTIEACWVDAKNEIVVRIGPS